MRYNVSTIGSDTNEGLTSGTAFKIIQYATSYEVIEQIKQSEKKDYFKIFDYKEMIDLAEKNEYKQVRQSGDHIIMQHIKTNKIVPIPAHELKYGLMLQIQKQIQTNKIS